MGAFLLRVFGLIIVRIKMIMLVMKMIVVLMKVQQRKEKVNHVSLLSDPRHLGKSKLFYFWQCLTTKKLKPFLDENSNLTIVIIFFSWLRRGL